MIYRVVRTRLMLSACVLAFPAAAQAADTTVTGNRTTVVNAAGSDVVTIEAGASIIVTGVRGINYNGPPTGAGPVINNRGTVDAIANADGRAIDTQTATTERSITINNFSTGIFRSTQDAIRILNSGTDVTAATLVTINNAGLIQSTAGQGIDLASIPSATVSITNSGTIRGTAGILAGAATIDSSGTIAGTATTSSGAGGSASNGEAIRLNGSGNSNITLRAGSITTGTGDAGNAIFLTGGNNIVTVETGATVNGAIRAGAASSGGIDTLNLTGSGAAILPGVQNFDRINFQSGDWTLLSSAFATAQGASIASGAIVRYGDGGTNGNISGSIENEGRLIYNRSDTLTQLATGAITGGGTVEIVGTGRLALTTTNSWTGATLITNGALRGDAADVFSASSAVVIGADGTLDLNGFDQSVASIAGTGAIATNSADNSVGGTLTTGGSNGSTNFAGRISGRGGLTKVGSGTLTLSGSNTFLGTTRLAGGGLLVTGALAGDVLAETGTRFGGSGTIGGLVTIADGARLAPGAGGVGTLTVGGLTLNSGSILDFELGAPGDPAASDRIQVNGDLVLDGTLNAFDVGGFGFGVYRLIDYSGAITDNGLLVGTAPAGADISLLSIQTSIAGQVNFVYGDAGTGVPLVQFWDGAQTAPDGAIAGGSGSWTNAATNWTRANGTANDAWNSNFAVFQGPAGTVTVDDAIAFSGMQFLTNGYVIGGGSGNLGITGTSATIRVDPGVRAEIGASVTGAGGLTKVDSGTLILSGVNTYAGTTNVAGGTLVLRGSVAGAVDIASGATLTGTGSAGGLLTIANGGSLAPGEGGIGSLTVGGLRLGTGSILAFDFGAPGTSDHIQVNGNLTLDGTLNAANAGGFGIGVYRLIDYTGTLADNGLLVGTIPAGFDPSQLNIQTATAGQVNLVVDAVIPEIQFWDGANVTGNGIVNGGSGSWTNGARNWADAAGNNNNRWDSRFAVFQGAAGTVTIDDAIAVTGMQFMTDGYRIAPGSGTLTIAPTNTNIRVDPGVTAEISAALRGTGGLTKLDSGTLLLSGANSYGGATTINGGTLRVLGGSAIPATSAVTVATGATLDIAAPQTVGTLSGAGSVRLSGGTLTTGGTGASTTYSGIMSGGGGLIKAGAGTMTLTGVNSFTGATTVTGGALALGPGSSIAASSGLNLSASGATFDIAAAGNQSLSGLSGVTGSRILLGAGNLTVNNGSAATFAGVVSGTGGIVKAGSGTLTLSGTSSYTGATTVNGGVLVVDGALASTVTVASGARLLGSGRIGGLIVGGTLAPGNSIGTLTIAGNATFQPGSTLEVETLANGSADLVTATGSVTINGGTVAVRQLDTSYGVRTEYRIITAGTTRSGTFAGVTSDLAFLTPTLGYTDNAVNLLLTRNDVDFSAIAATDNQSAVAEAVEAQRGGQLYDTIIGFNATAAQGAFDQLSGEIHADVAGFAVRDAQLLRDAVLDRTAAAGDGTGLWARFSATRTRAAGGEGVARASDKATAFLGGIDADLGMVRIGLAGGYTQSDIRLGARASEADLDSVHVGAYAAGSVDALRLRAGLSWSSHKIDTRRDVLFGGFADRLESQGDGTTWQGFGEIGWRMGDDRIWIEPFAGVSAQRVRIDAIAETGAAAALTADRVKGTALDGTAGLRTAADLPLDGNLRVRLDGALSVRHAFDSASRLRDMAFVGQPAVFGVEGASFGGTGVVARFGASFAVLGGEIGVAYEGEFAGGYRRHGLQAAASWRF
ncbi:MAG: autotransporter domain-containing protein [Sphingopyxis sp.]|nr:autotransporter domain-containing protein [Sphingopyxis sp.]